MEIENFKQFEMMINNTMAVLLPVFKARDDSPRGLGSSIVIWGSADRKENWPNGIFENSRGFKLIIHVAGGKRFYEAGDKLTVDQLTGTLGGFKFRKYTGTPKQVFNMIQKRITEYEDEIYATT